MVFRCRCFSFYEEEEIEYETTTPAKVSVFSNLAKKTSNLKVFTFAEVKAATNNFNVASIIGEGGSGYVFKGVIKSLEHDIQVAVKCPDRLLQGHKEWLTAANVLGLVADHPNLVKLLGYCAEGELLVYEYTPNRSVRDHLSERSQTALSWNIRLKVAQDAARGLAYLHEYMDFQINFRDVTSSNIFLDDQWNAKLSDFGMARLGPEEGPTHVSTMVVGTMVSPAPEYIRTRHLTSTCDVWSYGVFLYELITGRLPMDRNLPKNEQKLLEWVKPYLRSERFHLIIDPRLEGNYSLESAQSMSFIANRCLTIDPNSRPKMSVVLEMVNQVIGVPAYPAPPLKSLV